MKDLKICCVCKKQYEYCPKCHKELPTWMFSFCSEECKNIYEVMSSYENGYTDAETANKKLNKLNISKYDLVGSYKNTLSKINNEISKKEQESPVMKNNESKNNDSNKYLRNPKKKKGLDNIEQ
jgi:hypothetical protein|nr:MAG TPA: DNA gyrase inhibitor [Caudoviricetes sp.]